MTGKIFRYKYRIQNCFPNNQAVWGGKKYIIFTQSREAVLVYTIKGDLKVLARQMKTIHRIKYRYFFKKM